MKIVQMQVNHIEKPLGFYMEKPVFSYKVVEAKGKKQSAARICISKDRDMSRLVFDSGIQEAIDSIAYEAPIDLEPCVKYYWNVTVNTDYEGEYATSEVSWFETGKQGTPWMGKWITSEIKTGNHPILYKDFNTVKEVRSARLYVCGLGLYEAYINDQKVSDECLTPYCNAYDKWLQYQTYDITEMLAGDKKHCLEVMIGDGWYKGRFGLSPQKCNYGDAPLLILELHIAYTDGTSECIATDETWKVRKSKIVSSSIYDGEYFDETFKDETTSQAILYQHKNPQLIERLSQAVKIKETLTPVELLISPKGEVIVDMGQIITGWFTLQTELPANTKLTLSFCEVLQDGCFFSENLRTAEQKYTYISNGTIRTIRPHFTYFGYRYIKVDCSYDLNLESLKGLVLYSDLSQSGRLETGSPLINQLISNAMWSQKCNFLDVPTDCPQRDERLGWTGDAQVFASTACFNMGSYAFYRKYLYDLYQEQLARGGAVPNFVPSFGDTKCSSVWGDAATIIPWQLYLFYGDKGILKDQFDSMKAWVDYITKENRNNWEWREHYHWGDWLALDNEVENGYTGKTDVGFIAMVYYYYSATLVAKAAKLIERDKEAEQYGKLAKKIYREIIDEYFTKNGRLAIDTQTGYVLALHYGLAPDKERIRKEMRNRFMLDGDKLKTGFVGTPLLCGTLSQNGLNELAYSLILEEGYPGWLYAVKMGATTIWERWNSIMPDGKMNPSGMNSLNHYSYGSIVEWIYRYGAGFNPIENHPGFRHIRLNPIPDYRFGFVNGEFDSPIGLYQCRWEVREDGKMLLDIGIPFGGIAETILPFAPDSIKETFPTAVEQQEGYQIILEAGKYHIEYLPTKPMRKIYSVDSTIEELLKNEKTKDIVIKELSFISYLPEEAYKATIPILLKAMEIPVEQKQLNELDNALRKCK